MKKFNNSQEEFWYSKFGDDYTIRNNSPDLLAASIYMFSKIINCTYGIKSILEIGANRGINYDALKQIIPKLNYSGIEINEKAANELRKKKIEVFFGSILDFKSKKKWDLTLSRGVLIHINPKFLDSCYKKLYDHSKKYIAICEYFNPSPLELDYRGHKQKLFKRDFVGEMLDKFSDLKLVNYGFCYKRDVNFPQDDINWFLLEKC